MKNRHKDNDWWGNKVLVWKKIIAEIQEWIKGWLLKRLGACYQVAFGRQIDEYCSILTLCFYLIAFTISSYPRKEACRSSKESSPFESRYTFELSPSGATN